MSKCKLNQIIAVEKGTKERVNKEYTKIYQSLTKVEPMQGISRTYQPLTEGGEVLPPENKYIQVKVGDQIDRMRELLTDLFDVTYTKEVGNMGAVADISVDGAVILAAVPVTYLLFLEKQLVDLRTVVSSLPKLDPADKWAWNAQQGFYESVPTQTARTKKVTEFVVVPGSGVPDKGVKPEVKEVTNDIVAGYWTTVKSSATMEPTKVAEMVDRVDTLLKAVKFAREEANSKDVVQMKAAESILSFVFGT